MVTSRVCSAFFAACMAASPLAAQDNALSFSLTAGARTAPSYFGANGSSVTPAFAFGFTGLRAGGLQLGDPDGPALFAPGTGLRGAVRFIPKREGRNELAGLDDVDAALELGMGLHHTTETWQVFADIRYGVTGHNGFAAETGANLIYRADSGLVLHGGPRAEFGSGAFARSYFGVTPAEALGSNLGTYTPSGGLTSLGVELGAYQPLNTDWGITGTLRYDRLMGDAANSPITRQGSRDQISAEIGLTRHFNLRF